MLKAKAFIGKTPSLPGSDFLLLFSGDTEAGMCNYKLQSNISQMSVVVHTIGIKSVIGVA